MDNDRAFSATRGGGHRLGDPRVFAFVDQRDRRGAGSLAGAFMVSFLRPRCIACFGVVFAAALIVFQVWNL